MTDHEYAKIALFIGLFTAAGCGAGRISDGDAGEDATTDFEGTGEGADVTADGQDADGDGADSDVVMECTPGAVRCGIDGIRETCSPAGRWENDPCLDTEACIGEGDCMPFICERGETRCNPDDATQIQACDATRTGWTLSAVCPGASICEFGVCVPVSCEPGSAICTSDGQVRLCNEEGTGFGDPQDCETGTVCDPAGDECVPVICTAGETECVDINRRRICNFFGSGYDVEDCIEGTSCSGGECIEHICDPLARQCDPANPLAWQQCNATGTEWGPSTVCPDGQGCSDGRCFTQVCEPGSTICAAGGLIRTCSDSGTSWNTAVPCPGGQACDGGVCMNVICTPGDSTCVNASTASVCNDVGTRYIEEACSGGYICDANRCRLQICIPGMTQCTGTTTLETCNASGTGWVPAPACTGRETCLDGECLTPCELADRRRSSIGCVYYAIDTNPIHSFVPGDYAVGLSNTDATRTANIVIETKSGAVWSVISGGSFTVGARSLRSMVLPHRYVSGSYLYAGGAYRITSDLPIIAYQFNPLDGSTSYLSDASLLLPKSGLDRFHIVSAWPQGPADNGNPAGYPAHIQIVASATTAVRVTSTIATLAGSGVPALSPGVMRSFNLTEGDFLQLDVAIHMESFTGTYIESDQPVAVFSSNDCANVPADINYCCCEHLEEQLFGLQTWGTTYVASRVPQRGAEGAVWQILASENGTTVTFNFNASVTGIPASVTLNRGQLAQYLVNGSAANPGDFFVSADKPVHVNQYMVGAFMVAPGGSNGDPSMVQAIPVDQFLDSYVVLVPGTWINDYFMLTRPLGATVRIDGAAAAGTWVRVGTSNYEVARVAVSDGVHVLDGTQAFGVDVVGYDSYDSYAYPGGLNLRVINPM